VKLSKSFDVDHDIIEALPHSLPPFEQPQQAAAALISSTSPQVIKVYFKTFINYYYCAVLSSRLLRWLESGVGPSRELRTLGMLNYVDNRIFHTSA